MNLLITGKTTPKDINQQLSTEFPFLKIVIYTAEEKGNEIPSFVPMGEVAPGMAATLITIAPDDTVAYLKQRLRELLKLPVQVCRKSRDVWVETTQTDDLTLSRQNIIGASASKPAAFNIHTLFL